MAYTTIDDPSAHFHTQLYTGNGSSGLAITNDANAGDFKPDFLWIKSRSITDNNVVLDSSRTSEKRLKTNSTDAEDSNDPALITFETDGFDLDTTDAAFNQSSATYVAWQWKANGGSRTTFAEDGNNPAGGRQVNATAGFSIIDYTGTGATGTIAHGLGAKPDFWVIKNRGGGGWSWYAYHGSNTSAPETELLYMNNTDATLDTDAVWNDTAPTSSVFTVNTNGGVNDDDNTYICYLFTSIQGYSKFGGYTGNGDADGTFVYTGFKPALLIVKQTDGADAWQLVDHKRSPYNIVEDILDPASSGAEYIHANNLKVDFLSNGFKCRATNSIFNGSGNDYIYIAFAENPFVTSGGVPCTAR